MARCNANWVLQDFQYLNDQNAAVMTTSRCVADAIGRRRDTFAAKDPLAILHRHALEPALAEHLPFQRSCRALAAVDACNLRPTSLARRPRVLDGFLRSFCRC